MRWLSLGPDSPLGRWVARRSGGHLTPRGARVATFGAALTVALAIIGAGFAMQMSSTPGFCGSCHIMRPYYDSWKHSGHNTIACVECHISPGITAELRKKYEAMSMVVKYFTGTYGTNPWAEVDDAACLRCHERRLLEGKEVYRDVLFDHTPHLTESRRGLRLRCTSCHSQIVQGTHIAVTPGTCALCHFKGRAVNEESARCQLCHPVPDRVVSTAGTAFDHGQVRRLDMECRLCHGNVVRGTGEVPRERCLTCHNDPERLEKYGDPLLLHRMHVTDHKVDCVNCHLEIQHGRPPAPQAAAAAEAGSCASCHGRGHAAQQNLYAGLGGRGVPRMPGAMYTAGVTCEGCHNDALRASADVAAASAGAIHTTHADEVSCMSCHGPEYLGIYRSWKQGVEAKLTAVRHQLDLTAPAMGGAAPEAWTDARHNVALVEHGHGIHNVNFAFALLEKAHEQINHARRDRGLQPLARPWRQTPAGAGNCLTCHAGVENQAGTFAGHAFAHQAHVVRAGLACSECHRPHAERAPGEVVTFGANGCLGCHHRPGVARLAECSRCHGDATVKVLPTFRGAFSHRAHGEQGLECGDCHTMRNGDPRPPRAACMQCHVEE
jgi:predicted CXXCH cytochrome family protein